MKAVLKSKRPSNGADYYVRATGDKSWVTVTKVEDATVFEVSLCPKELGHVKIEPPLPFDLSDYGERERMDDYDLTAVRVRVVEEV